LLPIASQLLKESHGPSSKLDVVGTGLATAGLFAVVLGLVKAADWGWGSTSIVELFLVGAVFLALFVVWERRVAEPVLPLRLFRNRGFTASNVASLFMFFGMFGSVFLLAQFLQVAHHYSPLSAGVRTLPWTAMPIFIAPVAGVLSDRIGGRRIVSTGLFLQAIGLFWLASVSSPTVSYAHLVPGLALSGFGMALFFAPVANLVLSSVRHEEQGIASGAHNAIRELGGVFGVAVLATVFAHSGGYQSAQAFTDGVVPAVKIGALIVALGGVVSLLVPRQPTSTVDFTDAPATSLEPAAA